LAAERLGREIVPNRLGEPQLTRNDIPPNAKAHSASDDSFPPNDNPFPLNDNPFPHNRTPIPDNSGIFPAAGPLSARQITRIPCFFTVGSLFLANDFPVPTSRKLSAKQLKSHRFPRIRPLANSR
jgi:hypothetical protein